MAATLSNVKINENGVVTFKLDFSGGIIDKYEYHLNPGDDRFFDGKEITGVFFDPKEVPGKTYLSITIYYHYQSGEETKNGVTNTNEVSFYAPPSKFEFNNAVKGMTWEVAKGINSKIDNITDFTNYGTQYKMFLEQSEDVKLCPSMFNKQKRMSASQLNSIIEYLTNEKGQYKKGDKVGAGIFRKLENLINPPDN